VWVKEGGWGMVIVAQGKKVILPAFLADQLVEDQMGGNCCTHYSKVAVGYCSGDACNEKTKEEYIRISRGFI
jgi:hypothetical protein